MRFRLAVLVAVTSLLTATSPASATSDLVRVETLLYRTPLPVFVGIVSRGVPGLDTSTDLCSAPLVGSTGRSFDFRDACRRHDFGYRNLKLLDRRSGRPGSVWHWLNRLRVDAQFLTDMRSHCWSRRTWDRPTCLAWASVYHRAVRIAGGP